MRIKQIISSVFMLLAFLIVADFGLPGTNHVVAVTDIEAKVEGHNNASGNSHYSYQVHTREHSFYASEDFAENLKDGDSIEYHTSLLFQEVNRHRFVKEGGHYIYSLRWYSGLIIPLAVLAVLLFGLWKSEKVGIWANIAQILLVADLVFIFW